MGDPSLLVRVIKWSVRSLAVYDVPPPHVDSVGSRTDAKPDAKSDAMAVAWRDEEVAAVNRVADVVSGVLCCVVSCRAALFCVMSCCFV